MSLKLDIMQHLRDIKIAARTAEIARAISADEQLTQAALIELDDEDLVIMRNGWYLASAKGMRDGPP